MSNVFIKSLKKIPNWKIIDVCVCGNTTLEFWEGKQKEYTKMEYLQEIFKRRKK